jgi:2-polyprenyl-3-methyl-5-hydroxy-6-metoxy-1,4-benzoquinol methylase
VVFDSEYYDSIWGSVHRHDYCPYWADRLVQEFGRSARILDIGTGCGHLVKLLRERGCDAWGVDSSEYAIANNCAPGYVLNASVTDLPFKDARFDVVFSNGLWEYLTEEEIAKGAKEIWRVGASQIHNIDHDQCDYRNDFVTWKPQAWWGEQLAAPKVLVSCPTHELKEYAHAAWLEMARTVNYPNYEIFVVDNSATRECAERWGFAWMGDRYPEALSMGQCERMGRSMQIAQDKFLAENFQWWFNVEIDVIPAPEMLKTLLRLGCGADWIAHVYPARGGDIECCSGIGCSLWSRKLIQDFRFETMGDHLGHCVDGYFWQRVLPQTAKYPTHELWGHVPTKHLKGPGPHG